MKKFAVCLLVMIFCLSAITPAWAEDNTAVGKISEVETLLYGTEQKGSIIERTDSLETDINGSTTDDALLTRIERIYSYVKGRTNSSFASFLTKLNTLEWAFAKKLSEGPAKSRLEEIEKFLNGRVGNGTLDDRMDVLMAIVFPGGELNVQEAVLPKDALIKISIAQELDSKTIREGDSILFRAEDSLYVGNVLVIPKGSLGHGVVSKVSRARNFGRNGKVEINYTDIKTIDNGIAPLFLGKIAQKETENLAVAAGASVAGMIVLGPFGVIGGAFIKGKEYHVQEGALLYVQVREDTLVNGVLMPEDMRQAEQRESGQLGASIGGL